MANLAVWEMVKEAIHALNGKASYGQIADYINSKWPGGNAATIRCQIIACTVNHPTRVHYGFNKPGISNGSHDFLFSVGRGLVELYDPEKHGTWGIRAGKDGKPQVALFENGVGKKALPEVSSYMAADVEVEQPEEEMDLAFPIESHLRDFLAQNIGSIKVDDGNGRLRLFVNDCGRNGVEYPTNIGFIDILAVNAQGDFYVLELKVGHGPDKAMGQLARYMGWVKKNLANGKKVKGIIVAKNVDEKLKYAVECFDGVSLFEYKVSFSVEKAEL